MGAEEVFGRWGMKVTPYQCQYIFSGLMPGWSVDYSHRFNSGAAWEFRLTKNVESLRQTYEFMFVVPLLEIGRVPERYMVKYLAERYTWEAHERFADFLQNPYTELPHPYQ